MKDVLDSDHGNLSPNGSYLRLSALASSGIVKDYPNRMALP